MDYSEMQKPELIELCRGRGLPTSGAKEILIARLEDQDRHNQEPDLSDDELDSDGPDPEPTGEGEIVMVGDDSGTEGNPMPSELVTADRSEPESADIAAQAPEADGEAPEGHDDATGETMGSGQALQLELPATNSPIRAYRTELEYVGDLDDNQHRRLLQACHDAAIAAGYRTKGYPFAGHRLSTSAGDGKNYATYEVAVHRKD